MSITICSFSENVYQATELAKWLESGFGITIIKLNVYHCWMNTHSPSDIVAGIWWMSTIENVEPLIMNKIQSGMSVILVNSGDISMPYQIVNKFIDYPESHLMAK